MNDSTHDFPLHTQHPTERFTDRVGDYARFRPSYPAEAIDTILAGLGDPSLLIAADIGAGTGIASMLLAQRGMQVHAIEPNHAMRSAGCDATRCIDSITWHDGTARATGLDTASVDLILCAQSYHWFEPRAACFEFGRILKPSGRLALMWNDADETDPLAKGYYEIVRNASTTGKTTSHQTVATAPAVCPPFNAHAVQSFRFDNEQHLTVEGLIGRAMSASYVPKSGPQSQRVVEQLRQLHARHANAEGLVTLPYTVWLHLYAISAEPNHA